MPIYSILILLINIGIPAIKKAVYLYTYAIHIGIYKCHHYNTLSSVIVSSNIFRYLPPFVSSQWCYCIAITLYYHHKRQALIVNR